MQARPVGAVERHKVRQEGGLRRYDDGHPSAKRGRRVCRIQHACVVGSSRKPLGSLRAANRSLAENEKTPYHPKATPAGWTATAGHSLGRNQNRDSQPARLRPVRRRSLHSQSDCENCSVRRRRYGQGHRWDRYRREHEYLRTFTQLPACATTLRCRPLWCRFCETGFAHLMPASRDS